MALKIRLVLTLSFLLAFAALGSLIRILGAGRPEVEIGLVVACLVSVFSLWLATSGLKRSGGRSPEKDDR